MLGMTGHALGLSFRQLGLMVGPALLAVLPVIALAWCVGVLTENPLVTGGRLLDIALHGGHLAPHFASRFGSDHA